MKRITDFIVHKRYLVLIVMLALACVCGFYMFRVEVNTDMTKYLPDSSSMKQGIDLLSEEFPDMESVQTIRVMVDDISEEEADKVYETLEDIANVDSVSYEADDSDYVKDNHRLFILGTEYEYESPEEKQIISDVKEQLSSYTTEVKDDNTASSYIPPVAITLAISLLVLIMLAMCASWLEPFLFMAAIGVAVVLNMGTNVFLGSVANVTYAVAAILQLVLSMDYSIILSNRYRQERVHNEDRLSAMSEAMAGAFSSICSSSFTTFVGLLALVFMSFKIGTNLGIVLAKGVICSLICVMTVLPVLMLMFDKGIAKTAKRPIDIPTGGLAAFSYKHRKFMAALFVVLFAAVCVLHGNTKTVYILDYDDPIADVFPTSNSLVVLYSNEDEKEVAELAADIEKDDKVKEVQAYSTTLGKKFTAKKMEDYIKDMNDDADIDEETLKLLYYSYHSGKMEAMTLTEFHRFLSDEILTNDTFKDHVDEEMKEQIEQMGKFTDRDKLLSQMSAAGLSDLFGISESDLSDLLLFYNMEEGRIPTKDMTIRQFADFAISLSSDKTYGSMMNQKDVDSLKQMKVYTDKDSITKKRSAASAASFLGMDEASMSLLYMYAYANNESYQVPSVTLERFVQFLNADVVTNQTFSGSMTEENKSQLAMLGAYTDTKTISSPMDAAHLAAFMGAEEAQIQGMMYMMGISSMSPYDFVGTSIQMDPSNAQLQQMKGLMDLALSQKKLSAAELAQVLSMKEGDLRMMLTYYDQKYGKTAFTMSAGDVVDFILGNQKTFSGMMTKAQLSQLTMLNTIMDSSVAGTKYSYQKLAKLLGMDEKDLKMLYMLYASKKKGYEEGTLSPYEFINFISDKVMGDERFAGYISRDHADDLKMAKKLMRSVIDGTTYLPSQIASEFGGYSNDMDEDSMELMYLFYGAKHHYKSWWKMSIRQLFDYISSDIMKEPRYDSFLTDEFRKDIDDYKKDIDDGMAKLIGPEHSIMLIDSVYPYESKETTSFIENLGDRLGSMSGDSYMIGQSSMTYEMSQTFRKEMWTITLITAIAIFIVVMLTFRSLTIPAVLVLLVQCGVYMTITMIGVCGFSIYYLAMLIVQCILMGATIDYAILFTNYYRENRQLYGVKDALKNAYAGSIHTIMTSGLIMTLVTAVLFFTYGDSTVEQICLSISMGAFCALVLILFVLPGMLACFDKIIFRKKGREVNE